MKTFIKELTAKFDTTTSVLDLYRNGLLILSVSISDLNDHWFSLEIDETYVDFNFWTDDFEPTKYVLNIYPLVTQDKDGFYSTDTNIFERIPMENL